MKDPIGCANLGYLEDKQYKNKKLASRYYKLSCEMNFGGGCNNYGWLLYESKVYECN